MSEERWYTKAEYARAFRVSDTTIDRHVKAGRVLRRVEGRRSYFRPADATDDAPPVDPHVATLMAVQRLTQQVAALEAKIDALTAQEVFPRKISAPSDATPDATDAAPVEATPVAPRKASLWRRLLLGE